MFENFVIKPANFIPPKLSFKETDLKAFDSKFGVILWCIIKQRCLTDQHFDDNVAEASVYYKNFNNEFLEFLEFRDFPAYSISQYLNSLSIEEQLMLFRLMQDPSKFSFEIDGVIYPLDDDFRKIFKPEEYI